MDWLVSNMEWLFSGAGVSVVVGALTVIGWLLVRLFRKEKPYLEQRIRSGDGSENFQAGGDINFNRKTKISDEGES